MELTDRERKLYEKTLADTRVEMEDLDRQIEEELNKVKGRIEELQNAKKASRNQYDVAFMRLGIQNDLDEESGV